jgi:hypothetical protein
MIIGSLQQMMTTNKFNEPTGKGERFDRISVSPDYMNIETTTDGRAIPAGGHGMDYSIEESKTNKNMKKNVIKLNENTIRKMVAESVKKVLKENKSIEYEQLYDKIQDVTNDIANFCGEANMEGWFSDGMTNQLLSRFSEAASQLSDIAHEIEEHLAWD